GWSTFKEVVGSDRTCREVFAEMQQAESALLEAYEQGPKQAGEKLRGQIAMEPTLQIARGKQVMRPAVSNLGSILAWWFVAGDPAVVISDDIAARAVVLPQNQVFRQSATATAGVVNPRAEICRKVLARWVAREDLGPTIMTQNLALAAEYNL